MQETIHVRKGEEIDLNTLSIYLKENIPEFDMINPLSIKQFSGGYSNLTYLLTSGNLEMVLRRPPVGAKIKSAHDMSREYRILKSIRPVFPYCPEALVYCEDTDVIGSKFYIMKRIPGIILRKNLPEGLSFNSEEARNLCKKLLDVHVELHNIDVKTAGLDFIGKPEGYVDRQVSGWSDRYRKAKTNDAPDFETVMAWLKKKQPKDSDSPVLVHNDYKFDNVVLDPKNPMSIIGVLDWEMATYGDPLMDLGNSLAYWVEKNDPSDLQNIRIMPTHIDGAMTRQELVSRYGEKTGRDMSYFDYYLCFGLFRLAVIAQQIYKRYFQGLTKDSRFGMLIFAVQILEQAALQIIERTKI
ncbi:aminoglycoside phosphotransferase [Candidatus Magnetomorum sp. HK-1]|nr:aminoglycoside phosphotransferase [Candidatus Magnetomorum sp. HK-1]